MISLIDRKILKRQLEILITATSWYYHFITFELDLQMAFLQIKIETLYCMMMKAICAHICCFCL